MKKIIPVILLLLPVLFFGVSLAQDDSNVASVTVDGITAYYSTLESALDYAVNRASADAVVTLLSDNLTIPADSSYILSNNNVMINGDGKTIHAEISNNSNLFIITNAKTFDLENVTFDFGNPIQTYILPCFFISPEATMIMNKSTIKNITPIGSNSAGLAVHVEGTFEMTDSMIIDCMASGSGAIEFAVYVEGNGSMFIMNNGEISGCGSLNPIFAGGVMACEAAKVIMNGAIVKNCNGYYGAGFLIIEDAVLKMENCNITGNISSYGAGIYIDSADEYGGPGTVTLKNCTIEKTPIKKEER